jgi:hypothetical protein
VLLRQNGAAEALALLGRRGGIWIDHRLWQKGAVKATGPCIIWFVHRASKMSGNKYAAWIYANQAKLDST